MLILSAVLFLDILYWIKGQCQTTVLLYLLKIYWNQWYLKSTLNYVLVQIFKTKQGKQSRQWLKFDLENVSDIADVSVNFWYSVFIGTEWGCCWLSMVLYSIFILFIYLKIFLSRLMRPKPLKIPNNCHKNNLKTANKKASLNHHNSKNPQ